MLLRNPFTIKNHQVRVHLQGGTLLTEGGPLQQSDLTVEGVLAGETRKHYILWAPKVMAEGETSDPVDMSGHVLIPRERVLIIQVLA